MCLSVPAKVKKIKGQTAVVDVGGTSYEADIQLVPQVKEGDFVLIHTGLAIQIIDREEALASLKVFDEFERLNKAMDEEEKETGIRLT